MHNYLEKNNIYKKETTIINSVPEAVKVGAVFEGWYTASDLNESSKVTSSSKFENDVTLYPKFTISTDFYYEINGQKTTIEISGKRSNIL